MPQYLVALYRPNNYDPSQETDSMLSDISLLNEAMETAGVRVLACGLSEKAFSLRPESEDRESISHEPYLQGPEHIGGFWILETPNLEEALRWSHQAAHACRGPVEVRPILQGPGEMAR